MSRPLPDCHNPAITPRVGPIDLHGKHPLDCDCAWLARITGGIPEPVKHSWRLVYKYIRAEFSRQKANLFLLAYADKTVACGCGWSGVPGLQMKGADASASAHCPACAAQIEKYEV